MSVTPDFIGQVYKDTNTGNLWRANSTTPGDWTLELQNMQVEWEPTTLKLGECFGFYTFGDLPGITKIEFLGTTSIAGFDIESMNNIVSINAPNLVSIDPLNTQGGTFYLYGLPLLATLSLPLLTSIGFTLFLRYMDALTDLSLPSLVTVGSNLNCKDNSLLDTVDVSSWIPTNGTQVNFTNNALTATSIELILRRLVLAGVTTCNIDLRGGTNAGTASLNAQGQADVVTLGAQLHINP